MNLLQVNFKFLASLCSLGDWFETLFVGNPEDRFSRDEAQICLARETGRIAFVGVMDLIVQDLDQPSQSKHAKIFTITFVRI